MRDYLIYEHPLNERIRTFLRLEHLFGKLAYFLPQEEVWATRAVVEALLDILNVTARADIKTEILKEIDRHTAVLTRLAHQRGVDTERLQELLSRMEQIGNQVYQLNGQLGQALRENDFLKNIIQRSSIPGGTCSFDLPQLHHWLGRPHALRAEQIQSWLEELQPVWDGVELLLSLARDSSDPRLEIAENGFFQGNLDAQAPAQMVRIALDPSAPFYPEVSGHRSRYSIRFLEMAGSDRANQTNRDVEFLLTACAF